MKCQIRIIDPVSKVSVVQPQIYESLTAAARASLPLAKSLTGRRTVRIVPAVVIVSMHGGAHEV